MSDVSWDTEMPSTMSVISSCGSHEVREGLPLGINGDLDNLDGRCRPMGVTVLLRHLQARHQVRIADRRCDREFWVNRENRSQRNGCVRTGGIETRPACIDC